MSLPSTQENKEASHGYRSKPWKLIYLIPPVESYIGIIERVRGIKHPEKSRNSQPR